MDAKNKDIDQVRRNVRLSLNKQSSEYTVATVGGVIGMEVWSIWDVVYDEIWEYNCGPS